MYILGITNGHNATAALLKDGKIIACASEERFSRIKNHLGFPYKAIEYVLNFEKITAKEIDYIILTRNSGCPIERNAEKFSTFIEDYSNKSLFKKVFGKLSYKYPWLTNWIINLRQKCIKIPRQKAEERNNIKLLSEYYCVSKDKIIYADHHLMHAFSTVSNLPSDRKTLVLTLDGEGLTDKYNSICSSVNIFDGNKMTMERIAETDKSHSLGYLYSICTLYLGMKPDQHEFKVMGLAPYAKEKSIEDIYPMFQKILWLEGLKLNSKFRMQYADFWFNDKMKYKRFDNIAGAVQRLTEDITVDLVKNAIKETGIHDISMSGGVFMNVKANQKISELLEVNSIYPMPSSGDECTAIGSCFYGYIKRCNELNINPKIQPIITLYLGQEYSDNEIEALLVKGNNGTYPEKYHIKKCRDIEKEIALLLASDEIVARLKGRSEWGARALGNRSILSNPSSRESVRVLNELIKDRDFWMPFTPSILEEDLNKYIINPKNIECPFMIITFDGTEKARKEIIAAMHPYDFTIRPQSLSSTENPDYHRLISEFKKLTGIGAVLNTSFNLHGDPNVLSPEDAMHTFENSGLKYLAMGSFLISKEPKSETCDLAKTKDI